MIRNTRYVKTNEIREAVDGQEQVVLDALRIGWPSNASNSHHIRCPYPQHGGENDWRWDSRQRKAFCSCCKPHSIFDVAIKCEGLSSFDEAKLRIAELIRRADLFKEKRAGKRSPIHGRDVLLNPDPDNRDDGLVRSYLAHRLGIEQEAVPMPATQAVGIKALTYFDPPAPGKMKAKPLEIGEFPCAVFETVDHEGGRHALQIYLAPDGEGKAKLGIDPTGSARNPKKSARIIGNDNTAGRSVIWGDPNKADHIVLTEGVETGAAVAHALAAEVDGGKIAVAAAISAAGVEAFRPWPSTRRVTVAADRDEAPKADGRQPSRRGERSARDFGLRNYEDVEVFIALPGVAGCVGRLVGCAALRRCRGSPKRHFGRHTLRGH